MVTFVGWLLTTTVAVLAFVIWANSRRRNFKAPKELVHNCVLTKAPVEFWTGPRTLFYFSSYWNDLPLFVSAHGYDTRFVRLPWRDPAQRRRWATDRLKKPAGHIVVDAATAEEFADLFRERPPRSVIISRGVSHATGLERLVFAGHRFLLSKLAPTLPPVEAGALGLHSPSAPEVRIRLLNEIREHAESDWEQTDFPLESPAAP